MEKGGVFYLLVQWCTIHGIFHLYLVNLDHERLHGSVGFEFAFIVLENGGKLLASEVAE